MIRLLVEVCSAVALRTTEMGSHKHQYHAWTFFVVVTACGRVLSRHRFCSRSEHIVYVSVVQPGTTHDATHWNHDRVAGQLETLDPVPPFSIATECT